MKTFPFYLILSVLLVSLYSCDEQLVMVPENETKESPRKVLIEELTGVSCPNCPSGTAQLNQLKSIYGDNLVIVALHGNFLAFPTAESKYDFRNEFAMELENYLRPWQGKPAASVNRIQFTDELSISSPSLWSNYIDEELEAEHVMNLDVETSYEESTREVEVTVSVTALKNYNADDKLHLSIMVLQSEIEDAQEDATTIIEEYEHNHMLRYMLTGTKGDPLNKNLIADVTETFVYNYTIPKDEDLGEKEVAYDPNHMEIVAFVHRVDGDTKDVLQAAEVKIK